MAGYCVLADLPLSGISAVALGAIDDTVLQACIDSEAAKMSSYFRCRYKMPLMAWGDDVKICNVILAVYDAMVVRGYNPSAGADVNLRLRYQDQLLWLLHVSRQDVQPDVTPSQDQSAGFDAPRVVTNEVRGWGRTGRIST